MNIRLHIERLVLDGVQIKANGAGNFQEAVQGRLGQLLAEHGLPPGLSTRVSIPAIDAPSLTLGERLDGASLGTMVADSVHAGLMRHT